MHTFLRSILVIAFSNNNRTPVLRNPRQCQLWAGQNFHLLPAFALKRHPILIWELKVQYFCNNKMAWLRRPDSISVDDWSLGHCLILFLSHCKFRQWRRPHTLQLHDTDSINISWLSHRMTFFYLPWVYTSTDQRKDFLYDRRKSDNSLNQFLLLMQPPS